MKETFYITTPIYYTSANFHIGHCYTTIIADAIARYNRLKGLDVFFQTGTDEHGQKVEERAALAGKTPKQFVDDIVIDAKDLWEKLNINYDCFIRTTDEKHVKAVQKIFKKLYDSGDIYKGEYQGKYCTPCEAFWTETQLVEGKCPDCGREVHLVKEDTYFLRLSKYQERLEKYINEHPKFIQPVSRKNEMVNNFLKPGLEDLCVSRTSFKWGIPVDFDPNHVVYVWIDALSNYITSLGYASDDTSMFDKYWPADLHLVGKEIVRFHTIVWPILLMALGLEQPKQIIGHGWLVINNGEKISKSSGNYKDPREYIDNFGVDALRYFVLREVPLGNDGNFSEEAIISRTNSDLANNLGNLVNRTIGMINKYFDGKVTISKNSIGPDIDLKSAIVNTVNKVDIKMSEYKVNEAIEEIMESLKRCNKYIDETSPWLLAKDSENKERLNDILYNLVESIRICSVLLTPFMPTTSEKIFKQIGAEKFDYKSISIFGEISEYMVTSEPEPLFKRIEE